MQHTAQEPPSNTPSGRSEDDSEGKALRGNHSRPLDGGSSSSKHASHAAGGSKHGESGSAHARKEPSHGPKESAESSENSHDAEVSSQGAERAVIVPESALEPPSMVDTSANVQQVKQRQVFHENPNIYYMNGESLSRPMTLPPSAKAGIVVIIAIAAILASVAFYMYFDVTTNEPAREQARVQEQLDKNVKLDLPNLLSFLELDDVTIDGELKATGDMYFERSAAGTAEDYEIVKLPSDITIPEAAAMYATGVSKLTPSEAASLLNGSWDLMIERSNGIEIALHYADFKSGSESNAIQSAIVSEDLERGTETDSGDNDGYGNHYTQGTIMINGEIYDWTVSAVKLKDVYSISGLPDDAMYVGVRIRGAAE